jgi:hypothetical protein
MNKLYVWATNTVKKQTACQYYRIHVPLRALETLGYALCYNADGLDTQKDIRAMLTSDVCLLYSLGGEGILHQVEVIKGMRPAPRGDNKIHYPAVTVYDVDDNTDFVHPLNYAYLHLGIRHYPSGELLVPGENLEIEWEGQFDEDGKPLRQITWVDKETKLDQWGDLTFDIARNLHQMKIRHRIIKTCDGATTSSPVLKSYFEEVIGQKNVYFFPNTVIVGDYEHYDVVRHDTNVRIFWQGAVAHYVDWFPLKEALRTINQKYSNLTWVLYGSKFGWVTEAIPDERIEYYPWSDYDSYKLRRGLLNIDINLCPLANNAFNQCKSAIKWYEASLWDNPEATLAANVAPYLEIKEGKTGMLYNTPDDFVEKLSILIENAQLRKTLGENAKKWVYQNRVPEKTIPGLIDFYKELKDEQRARLDPKVTLVKR